MTAGSLAPWCRCVRGKQLSGRCGAGCLVVQTPAVRLATFCCRCCRPPLVQVMIGASEVGTVLPLVKEGQEVTKVGWLARLSVRVQASAH